MAAMSLGLYGITAYAVTRRRDEIGIRMALGATPGSVLRLVFARLSVLMSAGLVIGLGACVWATSSAVPAAVSLQHETTLVEDWESGSS